MIVALCSSFSGHPLICHGLGLTSEIIRNSQHKKSNAPDRIPSRLLEVGAGSRWPLASSMLSS